MPSAGNTSGSACKGAPGELELSPGARQVASTSPVFTPVP